MHNTVTEVAYEKRGRGDQKNLLHSLFFRATGAFRSGTSLALLGACCCAARLALFARVAARFASTLVTARYARFALISFLYFIHK